MLKNKFGQSTAEYAILIGVVIAAIVAVQPYVKRTLQGKYKVEANNLSNEVVAKIGVLPEAVNSTGGQYEFNEAVSDNTTTVKPGSGLITGVEGNGIETRTSTNITESKKGDYRGNTYKGTSPVFEKGSVE